MFGWRHSSKKPRKNRTLKSKKGFQSITTRRKRSPLRRVVIGSLIASVFVLGLIGGPAMIGKVLVWTELQQMTVLGLERVTREEVTQRLILPPEQSLLTLDTSELASRVDSHPWIESVTFDRVFPHSLVVQVVERQPAAVLGSSPSSFYLDAEGHLLPKDIKEHEQGLPIVEGMSKKGFQQDEQESQRRAKRGIHIAELLSQEFAGRPRVNVSSAHATIVDLPEVRFQFGPQVESQWQRFLVLYPTIKKELTRQSQEVDLRFSQKIILRKRTG